MSAVLLCRLEFSLCRPASRSRFEPLPFYEAVAPILPGGTDRSGLRIAQRCAVRDGLAGTTRTFDSCSAVGSSGDTSSLDSVPSIVTSHCG
jgi:hypothetical protein